MRSFRHHHLLESFLRQGKSWPLVQEAGQYFVEKYQASKRPEDSLDAIQVRLTFNYEDFFPHSEELLHLAVEEPLQFENTLKYCIFGLIRDLVKSLHTENRTLAQNIDIDQVHLLLRFLNLPLQQNLCFEPAKNRYPSGLCIVVGILTAISDPGHEV